MNLRQEARMDPLHAAKVIILSTLPPYTPKWEWEFEIFEERLKEASSRIAAGDPVPERESLGRSKGLRKNRRVALRVLH